MAREFFLRTDRLGFSKWEREDIEAARLLWGDPQVTRFIFANGRFSEEDITLRLKTEVENGERYQIQYWRLFDLKTDEFIGCCGLRPFKEKEHELGFHLRPKFWGQGYAAEAASAVVNYAFNVLQVKGLISGHHPENIASKKVLAKLGFSSIGDKFYEPTGLYHPTYELHGILQRDQRFPQKELTEVST